MQTSFLNAFWARLIVEELVRCGVETFFVAPGSRSTPLVLAVARHPQTQTVVHYDERGTAFAALGYARATRDPAAWITTSGTAVANGFPAVVEAATDAVPMLLVTADRPPERRDTAANQTVDQVKLFGDYARWQFDLPAPTSAVEPEAVLTTVDQAAYRARRPPAGPVHLNCMFRKPLQPESDARFSFREKAPAEWQRGDAPFTRYAPPQLTANADEIARIVQRAKRGLLVAGRLPARRQADAVGALAEALGWPLLPDVGSHLRLGSAGRDAPVVGHYDQLLTSDVFAETHRPDAVLHVGGRFVSKRLRQFLAESRPATYVLATGTPFRVDPSHQVTRRVEADPAVFCEALAGAISPSKNDDWQASWQDAERRAGEEIDAFQEEESTLSEPGVARLVTQHLPEGHGLVLASSMPVRDADRYAALDGPAALSASNRGASGIDGTVATAAGFALGLDRPATLVIGDLALLHDQSSLMLLGRVETPVTVVVLNNQGGGIFSFLPVAEHDDVFEPFFGTPHAATFDHAAAQFGLAYHCPESLAHFKETYREATRNDAPALIEVRTRRSENRALHEALEQRIVRAIRPS